MTAESPLIPSCPQVAVFCASTEEIAKFILLAFLTEGDGEYVRMEKTSASLMLANKEEGKLHVIRFLLKL